MRADMRQMGILVHVGNNMIDSQRVVAKVLNIHGLSCGRHGTVSSP